MSDDIILDEVNQDDSPSETNEPTQPTEEVPEDWSNLTGKAQDRFKKVIAQKNEVLAEKKRLQDELEQLRKERETRTQVPLPVNDGQMSPEERAALARLRELKAFVTPEDMEKERAKMRQEVQAERDREILNTAHSNLEARYDGSNGYPAYDRLEMEQYMQQKGIYDPEAAYKNKYWDEIVEAESNKKLNKTKEPYSERTKSRISSGQPWTQESLSERLRKPDGRQFYLKNKEKILRLQEQWSREG